MPSTPATAGVYSPIACHQRPPLRASILLACHQRPPPRASIPLACHQRPPPRASIPPLHAINARHRGRLFSSHAINARHRGRLFHHCMPSTPATAGVNPPRQIYHICRRQMSIPPRHLWRGGGRQAGGEVQNTNQAPQKTKKARHKGGLLGEEQKAI